MHDYRRKQISIEPDMEVFVPKQYLLFSKMYTSLRPPSESGPRSAVETMAFGERLLEYWSMILQCQNMFSPLVVHMCVVFQKCFGS